MVRAALVLGLGIGFATAPDPAWLFAMALTAFLWPSWWWRKSKAHDVRLAPAQGHHYHYCTSCDRQWPHSGDGVRCAQHWATPCADCRAGGAPASRTA